MFFYKTQTYLSGLQIQSADDLDKTASHLLHDEDAYERASQALRRRFVRGADVVYGVDRGNRLTKIKREVEGGLYKYLIEGTDGTWSQPEERIWVVAMYALWQKQHKKE
jgi:hypothetical protein